MNEILQQRIEEAAEEYANSTTSNLLNVFETTGRFEGFNQGATFALQNQWISVEEDLPPYDKDVFVRFVSRFQNNPNEYEVGYCTRCRTKDETVLTDKKGFSIIGNMEIKHWMPIPEMKGGEE